MLFDGQENRGSESKRDFIRESLTLAGLDVESLSARCTFGIHPLTGRFELAVSGGADSVAMLVLAYLEAQNIRVWHLDHKLRSTSGIEASRVKFLAHSLGAQFESFTFEFQQKDNLEERARDKRRELFIDGVSTGHTADDLVETFVINLMRGSGMRGLGSITYGPQHPILGLRRRETEDVCNALGIDFVTDDSNFDPKYIRNRVRHEILPLLSDVAKRDIVPIIARTSKILQVSADFISNMSQAIDPTDVKVLRDADEIVAVEALRRWLTDEKGHQISYELVHEVMKVVRGEKVAVDLPGAIRVRRSKGKLSKSRIDKSNF